MRIHTQHKALILTLLISLTMALGICRIGIKTYIIETLTHYPIESEFEDLEPRERDESDQIKSKINAKTHEAYNQNINAQALASRMRTIAPPKDYIPPKFNSIPDLSMNEGDPTRPKLESLEAETQIYAQVNDILNNSLPLESNDENSSVHYSLSERTHVSLPTPMYLCPFYGKIVISIKVDHNGKVIEAFYNKASNSSNQCLIESALIYAKKAEFTPDSNKPAQLGTITYYFEGKH